MRIYVALENLRSLHNIGAIFRTCSFFGVHDVLLVGYSGKTKDTRGRDILHPDILKTSLGSEEGLNIKLLNTSADLVTFASENSLQLIAVEQASDQKKVIYLGRESLTKDCILIFGNEVNGVSSELLCEADHILEIKKLGLHNSLNVSTTCGIVLFQVTKNG